MTFGNDFILYINYGIITRTGENLLPNLTRLERMYRVRIYYYAKNGGPIPLNYFYITWWLIYVDNAFRHQVCLPCKYNFLGISN